MFNQLISNIKNSGLSASEIEIELDNLFLAKKDITFDKYFLGINNSLQWDKSYIHNLCIVNMQKKDTKNMLKLID